ncbi:unannotated protein [freshwater metagenome]|uniref:Unannotated protein n=1 Tax=freshwater metagenome TaxID=449393 RepID=A0A6J6EW30_9ZZZZ
MAVTFMDTDTRRVDVDGDNPATLISSGAPEPSTVPMARTPEVPMPLRESAMRRGTSGV